MLKSPQIVVEQSQQQVQETFLLAQEEKAKISDDGKSSTSTHSEKLQEPLLNKDQSYIERHHLLKNHISPAFPCSTNACNRTGVSFSFSKKVHLKLESSASVFSENVEEAHDRNGSPRPKVKQTADECYTCIHMNGKRKTNVQKGLSTLQGHPDSIGSYNLAGKNKPQKENDQIRNKESVETHIPFYKENKHFPDLDCANSPDIKARQLAKTQKSIQSFITSQCQPSNVCIQQKAYKHNNILLTECVSEFSGQQSSEGGHSCELHFNPCIFKHSSDSSRIVTTDNETSKDDNLVHEMKSKTLPFLHVLSKDGRTAFHWPMELILFTKTEPSISYGCNPLYFDFRFPLSHKDNRQHEINPEDSKEYSKTMDIDGNQVLTLSKKKQLSGGKDNFLKPKKNRALYLKKSQLKLHKEKENKINCGAPKCISDDLNKNIPNVPAHFDFSQRHCAIGNHHTAMCMRSLAQHFQNCETTVQDEVSSNVCIYPLESKAKKQKCGKCDLMYSQKQTNLHLVTCTSNINESGKDMILGCKLECPGKCLEKESNVSLAGEFWKLSPLQKPWSDRHSNYSDISIKNETSNTSCCCNHRSGNHNRSNLLFCCKRKQKSIGKQKCKHQKHNCISSSDEVDVDCIIHKKNQQPADCTQKHPIKYQRHLTYGHLLRGDRVKQSRNRYPVCKHSRSRRYSSSQGSSIHDSGSTEKSSSSTGSRGNISGSFMKKPVHIWNKHKMSMRSSEEDKFCSVHSNNQNMSCASKHSGICSVNWLEEEAAVQKKSLTAKLLLQKVKSKRNQEQIGITESFSKACRMDAPCNQPGTSSKESETMPPSQENTINVDMNYVWNHDTSEVENHTNKLLSIDNIMGNTSYSNCVLQDLIQRGTTCQTLNMEANTAIKEKTDLLPGETQPLLQSYDPVTGDFPGTFVSHRYSLAPNFTDTKEECNARMDLYRAEEEVNCYPDNAMHKSNETEYKTELYSKCTSSPLSQQPIMFSPDEIDKYRFLQLQAQQHMQKQLVAKHLKVLSTTGPAAFSTSPAVQSVPVQQHASFATLHQTFLQSLALSNGVHPHSSHLSLTHVHPFPQAHIAPISISPFASTFLPAHSALLSGHPFHLVTATPIHPTIQLATPSLHPTAFIPTWFTPQLNATASSTMHFNPLIHSVFQGQKPPPYF